MSACDSGWYGENCSERCGECFGSKDCQHVYGTCMYGCKSGYQGLNCKKGIVLCYGFENQNQNQCFYN